MIPIFLHRASSTFPPPEMVDQMRQGVVRFFACFGVAIHWKAGLDDIHPTWDTKLELTEAIAERFSFPDQPGAPGHLVITNRGSVAEFDNAIGALVDTDHRGIAVVFSHQPTVTLGGLDALLQVCIHEIGHMLDLGHSIGDDVNIPSAMCQAKIRKGKSISGAWTTVKRLQPEELNVFPFSATEAGRLVDGAPERRPWGGEFTEGAQGAIDPNVLDLAIEAERDRVATGSPLGIEVTLRNRGARATWCPKALSPDLGTLELRVTRPDGSRYLHRPAVLGCGYQYEALRPGRTRRHLALLARGPGALLLPIPGKYRFEATVDSVRATPIEIEAVAGPLETPGSTFGRFVVDGAPPTRWRQRKVLNELVRKGDHRRDSLVALLLYVKARRSRSEAMVRDLVQAVLDSPAAPRPLRHQAWLELCRRSRGDDVRLAELQRRTEDLFDDGERDRAVHEQLAVWRRSADEDRTDRPRERKPRRR